MKAAVQINGIPPCPIWSKVAADKVETIWLDCSPHQKPTPDVLEAQPDFVFIQCAVRWWDLKALGWDRLNCPIIASCGDASTLCNVEAVFRNLPLLKRLYVIGYDYIDKYVEWCRKHKVTPEFDKIKHQPICADNHFQPLPPTDKKQDWCFLGQAYLPYDARLKHYRQQLIPQLLDACPNAYVSGPEWHQLIGDRSRGSWIDQSKLNAIYNESRAVVAIDAHDGLGYTSTRTIEIMCGGHCALIYDHPGMAAYKEHVIEGVHALYFRSAIEFADKLRFVRENPDRAAEIGKAARALVLERGWTASAWMTECLTLGLQSS